MLLLRDETWINLASCLVIFGLILSRTGASAQGQPDVTSSESSNSIGTAATAGPSGSAGTAATPGPSGSAGTAATPGSSGSTGTAATPGPSGSTGTAATPGPSGSTGTAATPGPLSSTGTAATPGPSGSTENTISGISSETPPTSWNPPKEINCNVIFNNHKNAKSDFEREKVIAQARKYKRNTGIDCGLQVEVERSGETDDESTPLATAGSPEVKPILGFVVVFILIVISLDTS